MDQNKNVENPMENKVEKNTENQGETTSTSVEKTVDKNVENQSPSPAPKKKTGKRVLIAVLCLVLVAALAAGAYLLWGQPQQAVVDQGIKYISVVVSRGEDNDTIFPIETTQEFLRGALEDANMISGDEGEFGLFVTTVDGYTADASKQEWWCFTKGGEELFTGVDSTPIENQDAFEITLTTGY